MVKMSRILTLAAAAASLAMVSTQGARAADTACGKPVTEAQKVQKSLDIHEIMNVAGLHEYYHSALMHKAELDNIWSHDAKGVTWTNNTDKYIGMESLKRFYVDGLKDVTAKGALWYHMLTTPVIEVAGDGKSAKGIFMSFGNVSGQLPGSTVNATQWTQEKYGIDFVKEGGAWKILHLRTYVDFYVPTDKSWLDPQANIASGVTTTATSSATGNSAGVKAEPGASFEAAKPDEKGIFYEGYTVDRTPVLAPDLPKPYCHFSEVAPY